MGPVAVTELRQWVYCPRVVYYHQLMPGAGKPTYKMREALAAQEMIERLELRRGLREYGFEGARRLFDVRLEDEGVGLSGRIDLLLERETDAAVVEFKLTSGEVGENHVMQLGGYALLVEAVRGLSVRRGFVFRIPDNRVFGVELGEEVRRRVARILEGIRGVRERQVYPEAASERKRCEDCEYANYCADVW